MISLKPIEKEQLMAFDHHMGLWAHDFSHRDNTEDEHPEMDLADKDIVAESLAYKTSASASKSFKLGCAEMISCSFDVIRRPDHPVTEGDLSGYQFTLNLMNELRDSSGKPIPVSSQERIGDSAKVELQISVPESARSLALRAEVNYIYAQHDDSFEFQNVHADQAGRFIYCNYIWSSSPAAADAFPSQITVDLYGPSDELIASKTVTSDKIWQCTSVYLGNFAVDSFPLSEGVYSRKLTGYDARSYWHFNEEITYNAGDMIYSADLLKAVHDRKLLYLDLSNTQTLLSGFVRTDLDEYKEYKITDLPPAGTVTVRLQKVLIQKDMEHMSKIQVDFLTLIATGGAKYWIEKILKNQGFDIWGLMITDAAINPGWASAWELEGTNTVKYLYDNVEALLHAAPEVEWIQKVGGYTMNFTYWKIADAVYSGTVLNRQHTTDDLELGWSDTPMYISDATEHKGGDLADFFSETAQTPHSLAIESVQDSSYAEIEVTLCGRTIVVTFMYGTANLVSHPAASVANATGYYNVTLEEWYEYITENLLTPSLVSAGVVKDNGDTYSEEDEDAIDAIKNKIYEIIGTIHTRWYPDYGTTYGEYNPVEVQDHTDTPTGIRGQCKTLHTILLSGIGRFGVTDEIIELTDNRDSQTGYIYFDPDLEISDVTAVRYTAEPLANLQAKASSAVSLTIRQIIQAYSELKGAIYDDKYHTLKYLTPGLYPANDLFPSDDLYPTGGNTEHVTYVGLIRKLVRYAFDSPLRYKGIRMQIPDGWTDDDIRDLVHPSYSVYEISNEFSKLFRITPDMTDTIFDQIWMAIGRESLRSVAAELVSQPWAELGDYLSIELPDGEVVTILLYDRQIKGIQASVDVISQKLN